MLNKEEQVINSEMQYKYINKLKFLKKI